MDELLRNLRHGLRALARNRGLTVVTVITLALGIGATSAVFTLVRGVLLRPLPYQEPARLVALFENEPGKSLRDPTSPANFLDWKLGGESLEGMTAAHPWAPTLTGRDRPDQLAGLRASAELFDLLGVAPARGRVFAADDTSGRVVVLGHDLWQRRFGGDPELLGASLNLDGEPHTVIGVMPPGFQFPPFWATEAELWAPLDLEPDVWSQRRALFLRVFARLRPGVELAAARAEMDAVADRLAAAYPATNARSRINVEPLLEPTVSGARAPLAVLLAAVALVLAVACINVAALQLARSVARRREVAVRAALGAGRGRLLTQWLAESLLLAALGGAGGLMLAVWAVDLLAALAPDSLPRLDSVAIDGGVLAVTAAIAVLSALAAALAPALRLMRQNPIEGLHRSGSQEGDARQRGRHALVAAQVGLALVLLAGAGLLLRSLLHLQAIDPGFRTENLLTADLALAGSAQAPPERQNPFFERLIERVEALPGVTRAAVVNHLPIGGDIWSSRVSAEGRPADPDDPLSAVYRVVSEGYFETLGVRLLAGRGFDPGVRAEGAPVVVINRTLAETLWPGEDAVGRRLSIGAGEGPWQTVIGVAADVRQWRLTDPVNPEVYFPYRQNPVAFFEQTTLAVHTAGEPLSLAESVAAQVWSLDPNLPVVRVRTTTEIFADELQRQRLLAWLIGVFAVSALILAAIGLYGVMSYTVRLRTREIGVRLALGAARGDVLRLVIGRGLAIAAIGALAGAAAWALLGRAIEGVLYDLPAHDPATFAVSAAVLGAVVLTACWLPARRAARVSPLEALREE